ncbi:MAG: hypothetical protein MZV65_44910 [Chromatiales bacterium]|nr:hypothetical protein [Chromatiales bacterium]
MPEAVADRDRVDHAQHPARRFLGLHADVGQHVEIKGEIAGVRGDSRSLHLHYRIVDAGHAQRGEQRRHAMQGCAVGVAQHQSAAGIDHRVPACPDGGTGCVAKAQEANAGVGLGRMHHEHVGPPPPALATPFGRSRHGVLANR